MLKLILTTFFLLGYLNCVHSQFYVGAGPTYNIPAAESADRNANRIGLHAEFENRSICWLWFGVHADYVAMEPVEDYPLLLPHYTSTTTISPTIKFNPFAFECTSYTFSPYVKTQVNIGLAGNADKKTKFGVGTTFGVGAAYSFNAFEQCWMIDANVDWVSPNNIMMAKGRLPLFTYRSGITLSWRIQ